MALVDITIRVKPHNEYCIKQDI